MDFGLKGKTVVILGGSKGIGLATARIFLEEGAKVAICARKEDDLKKAAKELSCFGEIHWECVDATKKAQVYTFAEHVFERFGEINCWVNNVGGTVLKKGDEFVEDDVDFIVKVCFKSTLFGAQAAFRYMKATGGTIINVSSLAARCPTVGRNTLYGPMKAAIVNLTNTLGGEYAAYNIRVTCIMPGFTVTPMVKATISKEELDYNAKGTLLQRLAEPEEIARPIVFLAGNASSYMTATTIEVSGGRSVILNPTYSFDKMANLKY